MSLFWINHLELCANIGALNASLSHLILDSFKVGFIRVTIISKTTAWRSLMMDSSPHNYILLASGY